METDTEHSTHTLLLVTADTRILEEGSTSWNTVRLLSTLTKQLHVIVLNTGKKKSVVEIAENAWAYPTNSLHPLLFIADAKKLVRRELIWQDRFIPELIISDDIDWGGTVARTLAHTHRRKFIIQVRSHIRHKRHPITSLFCIKPQTILSEAARIEVSSDSLREQVGGYIGASKEKVVVIPPYVDISSIINQEPKFSVKERYPQFRFTIIYPGPLTKNKDVHTAATVLAQVNKKIPGVGMVVLGGGPEKRRFIRFLRKLNVRKNVIFIDQVSDEVSYYKTADLFLVTASFEDQGIELIKAFSLGVPVVTTDVGVAQHMLGDTQYRDSICSIRDSICLSEKVLSIIEHNRLRNEFRLNAQGFAYERIVPEKEAYLAQYQQMWDTLIHGEGDK